MAGKESETTNLLKQKAIDLIDRSYEIAKSRREVSNRLGENQWLYIASGMEKLAVGLELLSPAETKKIHESYHGVETNPSAKEIATTLIRKMHTDAEAARKKGDFSKAGQYVQQSVGMMELSLGIQILTKEECQLLSLEHLKSSKS